MSEVVGPDPRARAGRRLRRQGGRAGRGPDLRPRHAISTKRRSPNMRRLPRRVRAAMQQWLKRPALTIVLSTRASARPMPNPRPRRHRARPRPAAPAVKPTRAIPPVGQLAALDFPDIVHTMLGNGIPVDYVQRAAVPTTQLALAFDAGDASDAPDARGLAALAMNADGRGHGVDELAGAGRGRRSGSAPRSAPAIRRTARSPTCRRCRRTSRRRSTSSPTWFATRPSLRPRSSGSRPRR